MAGYAVGHKNSSQKLDFDLYYSQALVSPYFIEDDEHQFYAAVTYKFSLFYNS